MMEHRVALPEPELAILDGKQLTTGNHFPAFTVKQAYGSRIITGVDSEIITHNSFAIAPNTPLTNAESSSPVYFLASSTASLIETDTGISS